MKESKEKTLNCVCPYGKDLPITTEKCPKCGLDLAPLSRMYQLSDKYMELGEENVQKHRPGVAISYYNSAEHSAFLEDPNPLIRAIDIYIEEKNSKLASDLLDYAKERYPDLEIWKSTEVHLEKLTAEKEKKERQQSVFKTGLYVASSLLLILLASSFIFFIKSKNKETDKTNLTNYVADYKNQLAATAELRSINITSDSLVHFSGKLDWMTFQKFWSILSSSDLPLSKVNIQEVSVINVPKQVVYIDYKVRSGESLSKIAYSIYHDPARWQIIFDANKDILTNKNVLKPGIQIKVPIENSLDNE